MVKQDIYNSFELKNKMVKSFNTLLLREFTLKGISFLGQILLFRIIAPEYFGIFIIISFLVNCFDLFSDLGMTFAFIRSKEAPSQEVVSSIFFIKQGLAFLLFILLFIISPYIVKIYVGFGQEQVMMLRIYSIILLIKPLRTILISLLERGLQYGSVSLIDISSVVVYYILVIFFAANNFSVWSFIYATIAKEFIQLILSYIIYPIKLYPYIRFLEVKEYARFGIFIQAGGIVNFIHDSMSPLIAGTLLGSYPVGLLNWSYSLALIPRSLTDNFGRVAYSGFSRIQDKKDVLIQSVDRSIGILSAITLFFTILIVGFGNEIVEYVYTDKWIAAVPALQWFAASTIFVAVISPIGQALLVKGKSKSIFTVSITLLIIELISAYITVNVFGFVGVAITSFMISVLGFISYYILAIRNELYLNIKKVFLLKINIIVICLLAVFIMHKLFVDSFQTFFLMLIVTSVLYLISLYFFAYEDLKVIIDIIKELFYTQSRRLSKYISK